MQFRNIHWRFLRLKDGEIFGQEEMPQISVSFPNEFKNGNSIVKSLHTKASNTNYDLLTSRRSSNYSEFIDIFFAKFYNHPPSPDQPLKFDDSRFLAKQEMSPFNWKLFGQTNHSSSTRDS